MQATSASRRISTAPESVAAPNDLRDRRSRVRFAWVRRPFRSARLDAGRLPRTIRARAAWIRGVGSAGIASRGSREDLAKMALRWGIESIANVGPCAPAGRVDARGRSDDGGDERSGEEGASAAAPSNLPGARARKHGEDEREQGGDHFPPGGEGSGVPGASGPPRGGVLPPLFPPYPQGSVGSASPGWVQLPGKRKEAMGSGQHVGSFPGT